MQILPGEVSSVAEDAARALDCAFKRALNGDVNVWIARCQQDLAQLWTDGNLWYISEVHDTPIGMVLHLVACAGTYDDGKLMKEIEDWARSIGCVRSILSGRKGWARRILDYKVTTVTMEKRL